nr:hypothetical protein [Tanacetum cinerariifolium]
MEIHNQEKHRHQNELIHYCLQNPPYKFKWIEKAVPLAKGSSETTTEGYMENNKNVSQDIRNQLDAETEAIQIILTWIDNNIYSTVDACLNLCEIWKTIEKLKQVLTSIKKFVTLVKQSHELKTVSYHKLYDILKQHQNEVNKIRAKRLARTANLVALVAQQQPVYHPQKYPNHYTQNSLTRSQPTATRNKGNAIVNSPPPTYDQEPKMVAKDDALSKDKEIDKLMALISLSFKKIYKPINNNLKTENIGTQVVQQFRIQCYNYKEYRHVARECQKQKRAKDAAYHKEKMLLCKQEEAGFQLNGNQGNWRDDTDDETEDHELEARYLYMAKTQEVTPYADDNSGPIFDAKPFDTYLEEQGDTNITIDSLYMSTNKETIDQGDDDLAKERDLLVSLIEKLKCEINDIKNRKKFLETSNKTLIDKVKDLKKFQVKLDRYHDVNYTSKMEIYCAKAKGDLMSYKMQSQKPLNEHIRKINDLNQMISEIKKELVVHQETVSKMSQEKEAHNKIYKTHEDKEIKKVIALENKVKFLDDIVYIKLVNQFKQ